MTAKTPVSLRPAAHAPQPACLFVVAIAAFVATMLGGALPADAATTSGGGPSWHAGGLAAAHALAGADAAHASLGRDRRPANPIGTEREPAEPIDEEERDDLDDKEDDDDGDGEGEGRRTRLKPGRDRVRHHGGHHHAVDTSASRVIRAAGLVRRMETVARCGAYGRAPGPRRRSSSSTSASASDDSGDDPPPARVDFSPTFQREPFGRYRSGSGRERARPSARRLPLGPTSRGRTQASVRSTLHRVPFVPRTPPVVPAAGYPVLSSQGLRPGSQPGHPRDLSSLNQPAPSGAARASAPTAFRNPVSTAAIRQGGRKDGHTASTLGAGTVVRFIAAAQVSPASVGRH